VKGMGQIRVLAYENNGKKLLADIAQEVSVDVEELKSYNKWVKSGRIPADRSYTVMIPATGNTELKLPETLVASKQSEPVAETNVASAQADRTKINGIKALKAGPAKTAAELAKRAGVKISDFLKWNDIAANTPLSSEQYYLLGKKRSRGSEAYHKVSVGETLWQISQQYGVQMKKLRRYNRLSTQDEAEPGMTLWLASKKPKDFKGDTTEPAETIEVDNQETFAWSSEGHQPVASVSKKIPEASPIETIPAPVAEAETSISLSTDSVKNTVDSSKTIQPQTEVATVPDSVVKQAKVETISRKIKEHQVKTGETLYGIANNYHVGVMDLVRWNDLDIQAGIKPGQILKLSESQPVIAEEVPIMAKKEIEHEVRTTDTLYSIARKYGVTIKELMEWNNKKDFTLAIGEKLRIQER
jgi:membrane-bound lytic murein transglycosylase D